MIARPQILTFLCWLITLTLTLLPILAAEYPPGADMLNHLARVHILHNLANDADLSQYYQADWSIIPNLAIDVFAAPLLYVLPTAIVGKLFIALTLMMMFAGVSALRFQLYGKIGLLPLCVGLIAYSTPVALGLANYGFGLGLMMMMIAAWCWSEQISPAARFVMGCILSVVLFFSHLIAFGLYAFTLFSMRLAEWRHGLRPDIRQDFPLIGQFIIPVILWFQVGPSGVGTETIFGSPFTRLEALISPVLYFNDFDIVAALSLLILLAWLLISRRVTLSPVLLLPIIALLIISLIMPVRLIGIWLTHIRIPLLVALLVIAALEVHIAERKLRNVVAIALIIIGLLRLEKVHTSIATCDAKRQEFASALAPLQNGSRLLTVIEKDSVTGDCLFSNYWHLPSLAVIQKSAFYPMMFVHLQPLAIRPQFSHLVQKISEPASPKLLHGETNARGEPAWNATIATNWRNDFDYLVWLHPGTNPKRIPQHVRKVAGEEFFSIFKIGSN